MLHLHGNVNQKHHSNSATVRRWHVTTKSLTRLPTIKMFPRKEWIQGIKLRQLKLIKPFIESALECTL